MPKKVGKYKLGRTLGEGTFGKVKLAQDTKTGKNVAVKVLDKESIQQQNMGAQIKKEISIMKMVKHPNVVNLIEVLASRSKIFIVLEFISGGELFDKIVDAGKFNEKQARYYFRQLVFGVKFCHDQGVCHRDLKPENLLLDQEDNLKISDFGLSAFSLAQGASGSTTTTSQLLHTTCGTPNYVAPEVLADRGYDGKAADVWSIGVILYVLLAGFLPFDEPTMSGLFRKIQKGEFTFPPWFSGDVKSLLSKILVTDPKKRVTLAQITKEKWFNEGFATTPATGAAAAAGGDASKPKELIKIDSSDVREAVSALSIKDEEKSSDADAASAGPLFVNAFDMINLIGGVAFDSMLHYGGGKGATHTSKNKPFFMSNLRGDVIMNKLQEIIKEDPGADVDAVNAKEYTVKVAIKNKAAVSMNIRVHVILDSLHLIEISKGRGDTLIYHKYLQSILPRIISRIGPGMGRD